MKAPTDLDQSSRRGLALCRRGEWDEGLALLSHAAETRRRSDLSGLVFSYLGYGIARFRKRYREGLSLCEYAVRIDACEPEAYLNLARLLMLLCKRRRALGVLNRGLALAPRHDELVALRTDLGVRRAPVLPFLMRSNPINRVLGVLRHRFRSTRA